MPALSYIQNVYTHIHRHIYKDGIKYNIKITIVNNKVKKGWLVDIIIPGDSKTERKEQEMITT